MRTVMLTMILTLLSNTACSVVGVRTAEELQYDVLEADAEFEIRAYAPYIAAEARSTDAKNVNGSLFRILAGYIFGKNTTDESIAMTAPVVMEASAREPTEDTSEKIAMTAPVVMEEEAPGEWRMAFSMPAKYTMETLPKPLDPRVKLVEMPPRTLAVVRYAGTFDNRGKRTEMEQALRAWVSARPEYQIVGKVFYAGYDPPFTLPALRRNEVMVEVIREETVEKTAASK